MAYGRLLIGADQIAEESRKTGKTDSSFPYFLSGNWEILMVERVDEKGPEAGEDSFEEAHVFAGGGVVFLVSALHHGIGGAPG
jgi:hypothetical protein